MSKGVLKEVALTIKVLTSRRSEFSSVRLAGRHRRRFAQFLWRHRGNDFLGLQNQQSHHPKTTSPPPKSKLPTSINNAIQQILPHKSQARKSSPTKPSRPTMDQIAVSTPLFPSYLGVRILILERATQSSNDDMWRDTNCRWNAKRRNWRKTKLNI